MTRFTNRTIWQTAYPVLISLLMENVIGMTDTAFMGRVGEVELGGSALGGIFFLIFYMAAFGFSIGAQILIGRRNGEGKYPDIGALFQQGVLFLLLLAALLFIGSELYFPALLGRLIASEDVLRATLDYLDWRVYGFFFAFVGLMFRAFFVGITSTRILTLNSLVMVVSNIGLNYVLVFGKLGLPAMGIAGAALGSAIAEGISMVFFVIYTYYRVAWQSYRLFNWIGFSRRLLGRMLSVSVWTMMQSVVSISTWFLFFLAIERLGERSLAISNIVRSIAGFAFLIVHAYAATASSLVSNLMGAGAQREVLPVCRKIIAMCYATVLPLVLFMMIWPEVLLRIYTDDAGLLAASVASMRVMASSYFFTASAMVLFNAVSGTGNTRHAMLLEFVVLLFYIGYMVWIVVIRQSDVAVCWTTEHFYALFMLVFSGVYMKKARWQSKKI